MVKLLKFHNDLPYVMVFMIYKFQKKIFLELLKILEYFVVERKNGNNLTIIFNEKVGRTYTMARFISINDDSSISSKLKHF